MNHFSDTVITFTYPDEWKLYPGTEIRTYTLRLKRAARTATGKGKAFLVISVLDGKMGDAIFKAMSRGPAPRDRRKSVDHRFQFAGRNGHAIRYDIFDERGTVAIQCLDFFSQLEDGAVLRMEAQGSSAATLEEMERIAATIRIPPTALSNR